MLQLLQQLHAHACSGQPQPKLPVQSHDKRLPSSKRGLSLAAIRALRRFFAAHGMLDRPLSEVIDRSGTWEGTSGYAGKGADGIFIHELCEAYPNERLHIARVLAMHNALDWPVATYAALVLGVGLSDERALSEVDDLPTLAMLNLSKLEPRLKRDEWYDAGKEG